eukprot:3018906-Alexandrium_andersonii.AAC.1
MEQSPGFRPRVAALLGRPVGCQPDPGARGRQWLQTALAPRGTRSGHAARSRALDLATATNSDP